jgi:hypothetical protein
MLQQRLSAVMNALQQVADERLDLLVAGAMNLWPRLGVTTGNRPWQQAARTFGALAQQAQRRIRDADGFFTEPTSSSSSTATATGSDTSASRSQ